jgi:phage terminase Nu1 subunit (DNA packaging protein)
MIIAPSKLADFLGITDRRINQLVEEGVLSKLERGKYDLGKCIRAYIAYKDRQIEELQQGGEQKRQAEERKALAQAEMLEIELAEKQGRMVDVETVIRELEPVITEMRGAILGIPKRAARELQDKTIEVWLNTETRKALNAISSIPDRLKRYQPTPAPGDSATASPGRPAADVDHQPVGRHKKDPQPRGQRRKRTVGNRKG